MDVYMSSAGHICTHAMRVLLEQNMESGVIEADVSLIYVLHFIFIHQLIFSKQHSQRCHKCEVIAEMWDFPSASMTLFLTASHEFSQVRAFCSSDNVTMMKLAIGTSTFCPVKTVGNLAKNFSKALSQTVKCGTNSRDGDRNVLCCQSDLKNLACHR